MNFAISYKCPIGLACVTMQMNFIFFALGKKYNTCGKRLFHLRELLHLWEDIITLVAVVGYYKFSDARGHPRQHLVETFLGSHQYLPFCKL